MGGKQVVNPERRRKRYSREFKLEAVRQLDLGQKPVTQLALELGVARNRLYKWQAQLRSGKRLHAAPGRPKQSEESVLSQLKRKLRRVTEDLDKLKKAQAYFIRRRG